MTNLRSFIDDDDDDDLQELTIICIIMASLVGLVVLATCVASCQRGNQSISPPTREKLIKQDESDL